MALKLRYRSLALLVLSCGFLVASQRVASAPPLPNPVIYLMGTEVFQTGNKQFIRYRFDVFNKEAYPADLFAAAPGLPPCGTNTKASRTWVDIFDQGGKRLFEFCALKSPADLNGIYFALDPAVVPPSYIYVELNDRQTNTKYKSNLADTTL